MSESPSENLDKIRAMHTVRTSETGREMAEAGFEFPEINFAQRLDNETDSEQKPYQGKVYWVDFKGGPEAKSKSGKLFIPIGGFNSELIGLYGGLPGDSIVRMEKRFTNPLLQGGYAVWVSRHNGTKLNDANLEKFFGSHEVLEETEATGKTFVGEPLNSEFLEDFAMEPEQDLEIFSKQKNIKSIYLLGHSFGTTSIIHSLGKDQEFHHRENWKKVKKVIFVNGLIGNGTFPESDDKTIGGSHLTPRQLNENQVAMARVMFEIPEPVQAAGSMKQILAYNNKVSIPPEIRPIIIASPTDAYITPDAAEEFRKRTDGLLIYDLTRGSHHPEDIRPSPKSEDRLNIFGPEFEEATPEIIKLANAESRQTHGGSQHDAPNFQGDVLKRLIEAPTKGHRVVFRGN